MTWALPIVLPPFLISGFKPLQKSKSFLISFRNSFHPLKRATSYYSPRLSQSSVRYRLHAPFWNRGNSSYRCLTCTRQTSSCISLSSPSALSSALTAYLPSSSFLPAGNLGRCQPGETHAPYSAIFRTDGWLTWREHTPHWSVRLPYRMLAFPLPEAYFSRNH